MVLAIIRDSGPSHPSGSGDSSGSGSGGGGQGGRATNEALAAAAKVLVVANPGSASKQSQSFGSPVATALQVYTCGRAGSALLSLESNIFFVVTTLPPKKTN